LNAVKTKIMRKGIRNPAVFIPKLLTATCCSGKPSSAELKNHTRCMITMARSWFTNTLQNWIFFIKLTSATH